MAQHFEQETKRARSAFPEYISNDGIKEVPMCYSPPGEGFGMAALNPETEIAYVSNLSKHGIGDYTGNGELVHKTGQDYPPNVVVKPNPLFGQEAKSARSAFPKYDRIKLWHFY